MHPILFNFGPMTIRTYGVVIAVALLVTFLLLYKEAKRKKFYPEKILDLELVLLISGIIGARALHVLVNYDFYRKNLFDIFFIWKGGLAFHGALIFSVLAGWVFIKRNKIPFWEMADIIAPYVALGHSIGRIGCFLNGCCFGKPTLPPFLGVIFPSDTVYRHPTQLYASLSLLAIFVILRFVQKKHFFNGFIFSLYLLLYSFQRFFIDFLRGDNPVYILDLTISQIISIGISLTAVFILILKIKMQKSK